MSKSLDYDNKLILAPMVRINHLPTRLLALEYGADIVYSEEIIDFKILTSRRRENEILGTVDYELPDGTVIFRTCPKEEGRLVFQLGTADAKRALKAAQKLENDITVLDVNMGCPQPFSLQGGMGAALLTKPEKVHDILSTLVKGLKIPVSCKIRILPKLEDTIKLVKLIESTGVCAIAVHGRTIDERPRHANQNHIIKAIKQAVKIPVIANGGSKEILCYEDIAKFKEETGADSVMIARAAEWNPSIFRKEGKLPIVDVIKQHVRYALKYDINAISAKYCILQIMHTSMDMAEGQPMLDCKHMVEICDIWKMEDEFKATQELLTKKREEEMEEESHRNNMVAKRLKSEDGSILIRLPVRFTKANYPTDMSPKQHLHVRCMKNHEKAPPYKTIQRESDRRFNSVLTFQGRKYTTPYWEKSKQLAEQGAAIACLISLGLDDGRVNNIEAEDDELRRKWKELVSDQNHNSDIKNDTCNEIKNNLEKTNDSSKSVKPETAENVT
ncbi:tRNA-dihydrouridine(20) synthase [NAD(P)+]-like isoform X1 [Patella vulgata]|uniref:tRNA-dihydrouridine(20) synthase [NAD(P)+]-like isoform X1 n=1 Tax=Patella vulgata TaxID=6465 RepID=UPI0024A910AD|nr:tRNA-dihydrouridine(20) synthase [NAD(P)+]-like isoform X1 [Patella vulgata]